MCQSHRYGSAAGLEGFIFDFAWGEGIDSQGAEKLSELVYMLPVTCTASAISHHSCIHGVEMFGGLW